MVLERGKQIGKSSHRTDQRGAQHHFQHSLEHCNEELKTREKGYGQPARSETVGANEPGGEGGVHHEYGY